MNNWTLAYVPCLGYLMLMFDQETPYYKWVGDGR